MRQALFASLVIAAGALVTSGCSGGDSADRGAAIEASCAACHRLAPPSSLPKKRWRTIIEDMVTLAEGDVRDPFAGLDVEDIIAHYEAKAPEELPQPPPPSLTEEEGGLSWSRSSFAAAPGAPPTPAVSDLAFARLFDGRRRDLVMADMRHGFVMALSPYAEDPKFVQLGVVGNPAGLEVTDLDTDGKPDIVVANLGDFTREDHDKGTIEWLRPVGRKWEQVTLHRGLGRVSDVQPVDLDGDRDLDLVVAEFGWRKTGRVIVLLNEAGRGQTPRYRLQVVDGRHGAVHVRVTDLNRDRNPDFVALLAQEFESVIAYLGDGEGNFEPQVIYEAPHPAWGSVSLELADIDGDGDRDALVANGDSLDDYEIKPYQGIRWLENTGAYPWKEHLVTQFHGVNRALPADLDGDGDVDVVASAFLPHLPETTHRRPLQLSGVIWCEQTEPGRFVRHTLEAIHTDHPSLAVADYDQDGDLDLAVGNFTMQLGDWDRLPNWVTIWEQE